jgi:hypothetical protein
VALSPAVRELNLECIAFKVAFDEGWSLEAVDRVEFYYRCFLQANLDNPTKRLAPTKEIDRFWHHHILDTQKYMEDCKTILGYYLHHFPYSGIRSDQDEIEQQRRSEVSITLIEAIATSERIQNAANSQQANPKS